MEFSVETVQGYIDAIEAGDRTPLPEITGEFAHSSYKVRRLLNLLVTNIATHYLEIGIRVGSTFIPAIYGNNTKATCIDNWSEGLATRVNFEANLREYNLLNRRAKIIEQDCWKVNRSNIIRHGGKVNVYFYDADHSIESQYKAVDYYLPVLEDRFILVIDDANWEAPRMETARALKDNDVRIIKEWLLPGPFNGGPDEWWNGLLVIIGEKPA